MKNVNSDQCPNNTEQIDLAKILSRLGGDRNLLGELIVIYREDYPHLFEQAAAAVEARDGAVLQQVGHALRGLIGNFLHDGTTNLAKKLEKKGRNNDWEGTDEILYQLKRNARQLLDALEVALSKHK